MTLDEMVERVIKLRKDNHQTWVGPTTLAVIIEQVRRMDGMPRSRDGLGQAVDASLKRLKKRLRVGYFGARGWLPM